MKLELIRSKTFYVKEGNIVYPKIDAIDESLIIPWQQRFGRKSVSDLGFTENVWLGFGFQLEDWLKRNKMRPKIGRCENNKFWIKFSTKKQLVLFKLRWL